MMKILVLILAFLISDNQAYAAGKGAVVVGKVAGKATGKVVVATGKVTVKIGAKVGGVAVKAGGQAARKAGQAGAQAQKIVLKQIVQETSKSGKIITKVITKAWNGSSGDASAEVLRLQQLGQAAMDYFTSGDITTKHAGSIENENGIVRLIRRKLNKAVPVQSEQNASSPESYDQTTTETSSEAASDRLIQEIRRGRIDGEVWD